MPTVDVRRVGSRATRLTEDAKKPAARVDYDTSSLNHDEASDRGIRGLDG